MSFVTKPLEDFIGKGVIFPIEITSTGSVALATGYDLIKSSLAIILTWPLNHRFFLPEFGSMLHDALEEPNDEVLLVLLERYVIDAIATWEKRIEPIFIEMTPDEEKIYMTLHYRIINSNKEDTFVYPFYKKLIY